MYAQAAGQQRDSWPESESAKAGGLYWSELAVADRLTTRHGRDILYGAGSGWFVWDGRRWQRDETERVYHLAKQRVRRLYSEAANARTPLEAASLAKLAKSMSNRNRIEGVVKLCRSEVAITMDELDSTS